MILSMKNNTILYFVVVSVLCLFSPLDLYAESDGKEKIDGSNDSIQEPKYADFILRFGQGGFNDGRSPIGKLGGGQMALDIAPKNLPVAFSLTGEYYTNSPTPTHPYEIKDMTALNVLYVAPVTRLEKTTYFVGGGVGRLKVPLEDSSKPGVKSSLFNLEAGLHRRAFWKLGFYGVVKYLYAEKSINGVEIVDFNEIIGMIGVTYYFSY